MSVFDLAIGERAVIKRINLAGSASARLTALGICEGKIITVLSVSLFKSSVLIGCGAVRLGVREKTAACIEVEKCA